LLSSLNVVIVGNGVAGVTAARIIKEKNPKARISFYTDESHQYYPRPRVYEVLSEAKPQNIYILSEEWYRKKGFTVQLTKKAVNINTERKELLLDDHSRVKYETSLGKRRTPLCSSNKRQAHSYYAQSETL